MARINRGAVSAIAGYVQEQRKREDEAHKSDQEFQQRLYEAGLKEELGAGRAGLNLQTGRVETRTPQRFDPSTLSPGQSYSQRVEGGTLMSRGPSTVDPSLQLQRELATENTLQEIEQRNALAPLLATAEREETFPPPAWGGVAGRGYIENQPNWFQSMTGVRKRPQAPAVPRIDTSSYRNRLSQIQAGPSSGLSVPTLPQSDLDLDQEVADLMEGIQSGQIRSRAQAEQVIEAAGLDPNDPTFQQVLNQLR